MALKQLSIYRQKQEKETYKIKPKWITDLHVNCKTIKLLEKGKQEKNFWYTGLGKEFLDLTPKA